MCWNGKVGAKGWSHIPMYVIVDKNVHYCKVIEKEYVSIELANDIIKENGWKDVDVIPEEKYTEAWNKRFV